jgi:hypothetical protein
MIDSSRVPNAGKDGRILDERGGSSRYSLIMRILAYNPIFDAMSKIFYLLFSLVVCNFVWFFLAFFFSFLKRGCLSTWNEAKGSFDRYMIRHLPNTRLRKNISLFRSVNVSSIMDDFSNCTVHVWVRVFRWIRYLCSKRSARYEKKIYIAYPRHKKSWINRLNLKF